MTPEQCKAARALLKWKQVDLAESSRISLSTVIRFEGGSETVKPIYIDAMSRAFESAGIKMNKSSVALRAAE